MREFPPFDPVDLWFDYPVHRLDTAGELRGAVAEGILEKRDKAAERRRILENAYEALSIEGKVTIADIVEYTGRVGNTIKNYIDEHPDFIRANGVVTRKRQASK